MINYGNNNIKNFFLNFFFFEKNKNKKKNEFKFY